MLMWWRDRWQRRSVRARLTAVASTVMAVALCIAAALLVGGLHRSLLGSVDSTAQERARDAARLPADGGVLPSSAEADNVVQIVGANGQVQASTVNAARQPRLFTFVPHDGAVVRSVKRVAISDAADSYRVAAVGTSDGRIVYAAVPDDDQLEALHRLVIAVSIGLPVVIAALALITWLLVGRALRPVEVAVRKQKDFVADAAHELRSPLAALRTQLEVTAPSDGPLREALPAMLHDVDRMSNLVDDLLQLARLESGEAPLRRSVDLDDVVFTEAARARSTTTKTVDVHAVSAAQVHGDASLGRLVRNLLDNAVRHAETTVRLALSSDDGQAVLVVSDDGPGVAPGQRERIFERFTRLDDGRSRAAGGAGLGLAIARDIAVAHGGSLELGPAGGGAEFVVRLPLADGSATVSRHPVARPDARPAQ
jgi:signal transduction histidine kinase